MYYQCYILSSNTRQMFLTLLLENNPSDIWDCQNKSSIHYNTNNIFPNKVLPVLDQVFSTLGALIHSLLIITVYLRYRSVGFIPLSYLLLINVCLAKLLNSANSIFLFFSSKAPLQVPRNSTHSSGINSYSYVFGGAVNTFRVVRVCSFMVIYIVRLLHEIRPCWLLLHRTRLLTMEKFYCLCVWIVGLSAGGFWTFVGLTWKRYQGKTAQIFGIISVAIKVTMELFHLAGVLVSLASVLYLAKFLYKNRPNRTPALDSISSPDQSSIISPDQSSIHASIKSCL